MQISRSVRIAIRNSIKKANNNKHSYAVKDAQKWSHSEACNCWAIAMHIFTVNMLMKELSCQNAVHSDHNWLYCLFSIIIYNLANNLFLK